jgi:hypothetical protein
MKKNRRSKIGKARKPLFYTADPRTSELKFLDEPKRAVPESKSQHNRKPVTMHSVIAEYETTKPAAIAPHEGSAATQMLEALSLQQDKVHSKARSEAEAPRSVGLQERPSELWESCFSGIAPFSIPEGVERIQVAIVLPASFRVTGQRSSSYALTAVCNQPDCQVFIISKSDAGAKVAIQRSKTEGIVTGELNWIAAQVKAL